MHMHMHIHGPCKCAAGDCAPAINFLRLPEGEAVGRSFGEISSRAERAARAVAAVDARRPLPVINDGVRLTATRSVLEPQLVGVAPVALLYICDRERERAVRRVAMASFVTNPQNVVYIHVYSYVAA